LVDILAVGRLVERQGLDPIGRQVVAGLLENRRQRLAVAGLGVGWPFTVVVAALLGL
jgi:hypothetical protein